MVLAAEEHPEGCAFDQPVLTDSPTYTAALEKAGAHPILLRTDKLPDFTTRGALLQGIDGVVFPGGPDEHPKNYGQILDDRYIMLVGSEKQRAIRQTIFRAAVESRTPILGICLGMQLLNVFEGGELHQDVTLAGVKDGIHRSGVRGVPVHHPLVVMSKKRNLVGLAGAIRGVDMVNSYHHQSIKKLATGYDVVAQAADGTIEAIEKGDMWGIQWHAETDPKDRVIPAFVAHCQARALARAKVTPRLLKKAA